ncbi:MAG: hypothetical protein KC657_35665 [Myxococcales bacterium]|nr:hypothetical protein [Myxococcales bacterium]
MRVLAQDGNVAVVQLPQRSSPALSVQGDSLSMLVKLAGSVAAQAARTGDADLIDDAEELRERLSDMLRVYESTLRPRGLPLPY